MLDLRVGLGDLLVRRPVELGAVVVVGVQVLVPLVGEERLVRVEQLDLQHPPVGARVGLEEVQPGVDGQGLGVLGLGGHVGAVDLVLVAHSATHPLGCVARDDALPRVALLPAEELPGGVARVVRGAAVLPVVRVVGDQVGVHAGLAEQLRHRVVERLEWAPRAVQEVMAAGVHLAPGGHARHRAGVEVVEGDGLRRQAREVRGVDDRVGVGSEQVPVEAVEHQDDGAHGCSRGLVATVVGLSGWWS
nr:hypothetical protein [Phytoactinopolyspora endophytica]